MQDLAPPKELYIEVRVLEDVGEIATEEGSVNLEKDTQVRMYPRPVTAAPHTPRQSRCTHGWPVPHVPRKPNHLVRTSVSNKHP